MNKSNALLIAVIAAQALTSCGGGGSEHISPPESASGAHTLESVPFDQLGSGKVAFLRGDLSTAGRDGMYVIDSNTKISVFEFEGNGWYVDGPAVSPDGLSVAYTRYTDSTTVFDAYVANLDGSGARQVSAFSGQEGPPSWSPDGHEIFFFSNETLYRQPPILPTGSERVPITTLSGTCQSLENDGPVSVSTAGQIAWACNGSVIEVTSPDGSTTTAVYTVPTQTTGTMRLFAPAWSPDDKRLAFLEITGVAPNGPRQKVLVKTIGNQGDNELLLATVPASGSLEIGGENNIFSLCWTADGSRVVFNVPDGDPQSHIWVVNADGSALTQVTSAAGVWDASVSCSR